MALPLAALLVACHGTPTQPTSVAPESVSGCYQLTLGPWTGAHEAENPPAVVLLLDSVGTFLLEAGRTLVRPSPVDTNAFAYMAWWARPAPDSLAVVFTTGYVGIRLALSWRGSQWVGRADAFTDVQPSIEATASAALSALGFVPACGLRAGSPPNQRLQRRAGRALVIAGRVDLR
jgi:hypothetical protein